MKFTFKPSPNYRSEQSTSGIMKDLTLALLSVCLYAVIYYWAVYGQAFGIRVILLLVDAVVCALATDAVFFKISKKDIKKEILSSYSWVTAIILVLISKISTSYFAMGAATVIAILFGKLVFGGFGQNIFNPAAFGEAIIMSNFASSNSADFVTKATPTVVAKGASWMMAGDAATKMADKFGGFGAMFLGQYASTIGSPCALLILVCGVYLVLRKCYDWQTPVFYIGTVFVEALVIGLMHGAGLSYALFSVLAGGVIFAGVFMVTDPVTNPVSLPGRIVFAIGAASLTLIIRDKSNLSDGCLFAILVMNMLTPAIDKLFDGNQIKDAKKIRNKFLITSCVIVACTLLVGTTVGPKAEEKPAAPVAAETTGGGSAGGIALNGDFSENGATAEDLGNGVYACSASGFQGTNELKVTVENGAVKAVELVSFGDTPGVGDMATSDEYLESLVGLTLEDGIDGVSGATFTSNSVISMVSAALTAAGK